MPARLKSSLSRRPILWLTLAYLLLRLPCLTCLPSFADEATYLDWGWREIYSGRPFHSLYDAKQPILMWVFGIFQLFISDPLLAGRLVSVLIGLATFYGLYTLGRYIHSSRYGLMAAGVYLVTPLFYLFDRQALMESALGAFTVWLFYLVLRCLSTPKFRHFFFLGLLAAIGFWLKTTSLVFLVSFFGLFILRLFRHPQRLNYFLGLLLSFCVFVVGLYPLFWQPQFWSTFFSFNAQYSLTFKELMAFPVGLWFNHIWANFQISFFLLTPVIFLLIVWSIAQFRYPFPYRRWLIMGFFVPLIIETLTVRSPNFRYLSPFLILGCLLAARTLISRPRLSYLLILPLSLCLLQQYHPPLYFQTLSRFTRYAYSEGYICCSATGYPTRQAIAYLRSLPQDQPIFVGVYLGVGNPPSAVLSYFRRDPLITVGFFDSKILPDLSKYSCLSAPLPVYFLAIEEQRAGLDRFLTPLTRFVNPYGSKEFLTLYTLTAPCSGPTLSLSFLAR